MKHTVFSIFGARPQFVKAYAVSKALSMHENIREVKIHSGQHYDREMSQVFFEEFGLGEPDFNLGIGGVPSGEMVFRITHGLEELIHREKPSCIIVYGDTSTTLAGALAAAKTRTPLAHVEAGMRSYDRTMPEEANRIITDSLSALLFCPTRSSVDILASEGRTGGVHMTGDVMVETFNMFRPVAEKRSSILADNGLEAGGYLLMTVHRASNTDDPSRLESILRAVGGCGRPVFFPVHPRTAGVLRREGIPLPENIVKSGPVSYMDTIALECGAEMALTDSGGIQKEAYLAGIPCVTLRENTEWMETVDAGWNILVGADPEKIAHAIQNFRPAGARADALGPPDAASSIAEIIVNFLKTP